VDLPTKVSFAVCHQVTTLDGAKLTKRVGSFPSEALRELEQGSAAFAIDSVAY
jgi:mRNA-degrading endonuclease toxin of MazEF toxin-antitoxin module